MTPKYCNTSFLEALFLPAVTCRGIAEACPRSLLRFFIGNTLAGQELNLNVAQNNLKGLFSLF